jgi:16S rRNA U516 pseudouridylate synthase RsuA-like enzyme
VLLFSNDEKLRQHFMKEIEEIKRKYEQKIEDLKHRHEQKSDKMKNDLQEIHQLSRETKLAHANEKQTVNDQRRRYHIFSFY